MENARKFTLKFLIAPILLFGVAGCDDSKQESDDKAVSFEEVEEIIITDAQAKTRFETYGKHRASIIKIYEDSGRRLKDSIPQKQQSIKGDEKEDGAMEREVDEGFVPVQYTSYDFEKFKKYIQYIEQETKKAGADISKLRIYFANYPKEERDLDKQKRNTVMFVPTLAIDGKESAYYIGEKEMGVPVPFLLTDSLERTNKAVPEEMLDASKNTSKASLFPNLIPRPSPSPFYAEKSVIGNEGDRHPPRNH